MIVIATAAIIVGRIDMAIVIVTVVIGTTIVHRRRPLTLPQFHPKPCHP